MENPIITIEMGERPTLGIEFPERDPETIGEISRFEMARHVFEAIKELIPTISKLAEANAILDAQNHQSDDDDDDE